jgi:hypothetical protein
MIPTLLITMYSTYSTQCTVRFLYPIPLSVFEGSRIPSKFKEEFNSCLPNPHVISFNIRSLGQQGISLIECVCLRGAGNPGRAHSAMSPQENVSMDSVAMEKACAKAFSSHSGCDTIESSIQQSEFCALAAHLFSCKQNVYTPFL